MIANEYLLTTLVLVGWSASATIVWMLAVSLINALRLGLAMRLFVSLLVFLATIGLISCGVSILLRVWT